MPMSPLWRGENEFHEKCLPSLYRREWSFLEKLERQIQLEDFCKLPPFDLNPKSWTQTNYYEE